MTLKKTIKKPESEKERLNTYVDADVYKQIAEIAVATKRSMNYVANEAYSAYISANLPKIKKAVKNNNS